MSFLNRNVFFTITICSLLSACLTQPGKRCEPSKCLGAEMYVWEVDWSDSPTDHDPGDKFKLGIVDGKVVEFSRKKKEDDDFSTYLITKHDKNFYLQEDNLAFAQFYFKRDLPRQSTHEHFANMIFYLTKPNAFRSREFVFQITEQCPPGDICTSGAHGRGGGRGN